MVFGNYSSLIPVYLAPKVIHLLPTARLPCACFPLLLVEVVGAGFGRVVLRLAVGVVGFTVGGPPLCHLELFLHLFRHRPRA